LKITGKNMSKMFRKSGWRVGHHEEKLDKGKICETTLCPDQERTQRPFLTTISK